MNVHSPSFGRDRQGERGESSTSGANAGKLRSCNGHKTKHLPGNATYGSITAFARFLWNWNVDGFRGRWNARVTWRSSSVRSHVLLLLLAAVFKLVDEELASDFPGVVTDSHRTVRDVFQRLLQAAVANQPIDSQYGSQVSAEIFRLETARTFLPRISVTGTEQRDLEC